MLGLFQCHLKNTFFSVWQCVISLSAYFNFMQDTYFYVTVFLLRGSFHQAPAPGMYGTIFIESTYFYLSVLVCFLQCTFVKELLSPCPDTRPSTQHILDHSLLRDFQAARLMVSRIRSNSRSRTVSQSSKESNTQAAGITGESPGSD